MLPKSERLNKGHFLGNRPQIFFRGKIFDAALLSMLNEKTIPVTESNVIIKNKFACVTSRKTMKKAVDRNMIKRRLFNAVKDISTLKQYYIVFYPKKGSNIVPYSHINEEISLAFATLKTIRR